MRLFYLTCLLLRWIHVSAGSESCLAETYIVHRIVGITLEKCQEECGMRLHCNAVNYRRKFRLCELLESEQGDILANQQACIFVKKSHMTLGHLSGCNCAKWETCNIETHECQKTECVKPGLVNGRILGNMVSIGSRIKFNCNQGYAEITGEQYAVCNASGHWSYVPKCLRDCGPYPSVGNAEMNSEGVPTLEGTQIQYQCLPGYNLAGNSSTLTCNSDGIWSNQSEVQCKVDCGPHPSIGNAEMISDETSTLLGTEIQYQCMPGYNVTGTSSTLTCNSDGTWSNQSEVQCKIDCGPHPSIGNAEMISGQTSTLMGTEIQYQCLSGYSLARPSNTLTCNSVGIWSDQSQVQCKINCGPYPSIANANMISGETSTLEGTVIQYQCLPGYILAGASNTLTCNSEGIWSDQNEVRCEIVKQPGDQCSVDADCTMTGAVCIASKCFCGPLYQYNAGINNCEQVCTALNNTFTEHKDTAFKGYNSIAHKVISTPEECFISCRDEPLCLSYEIKGNECSQGRVTVQMILDGDPVSYLSPPNTPSNLYSRDCFLN